MSKHTSGPWRLADHAPATVVASRVAGNGVVVTDGSVATCGGFSTNMDDGRHHTENAANARLIAAAPDLLEALNRIADEESGWRFKVDPLEHARSVIEEMREVARAAIAKAEGGDA